jgi:hypothetical protein
MDNVTVDEKGALSLAAGDVKLNNNPLGATPLWCYSKTLNNTKYRLVGLFGGSVVEDTGPGGYGVGIISGGSNNFAAGSGFGQIFIASGSKKVKNDGTTVLPWGLTQPGTPTPTSRDGSYASWYGSLTTNFTLFTALEGTITASGDSYVTGAPDATTLRFVLQYKPVAHLDLTSFLDGGSSTDIDTFCLAVKIADSANIDTIRVEAMLQTPPAGAGGTTADVIDYYYYEWSSSTFVRDGATWWATLSAQRADFQRAGVTAGLDWSTVYGIRVIFNTFAATGNYSIGVPFEFKGGTKSGLIAGNDIDAVPYTYYQVNVFNNGGIYVGKSPASPPSKQVTVISGWVDLAPNLTGIDAQVNQIWYFRAGGALDQPYFCCISYPDGAGGWLHAADTLSDTQLQLNGITLNLYLASLTSITDDIIGIEGPVAGRMALLTKRNLYLTDYLNPDAYDARIVLTLSGSTFEQCLFVVKTANVLVIGTTQDIYMVSGTYQQQSDGTFDVTISPLGIKQPPISRAVTYLNTALVYVASDGLRRLVGTYTESISAELDQLWRGQTCYGVLGFNIKGGNNTPCALTFYKNKLAFAVQHIDLSYSTFVYNINKQAWYRKTSAVTSFAQEDDGQVLAIVGQNVVQFEGGGSPGPIYVQSPLLDNSESFTRKDLFTLKQFVNTDNVTVSLYSDTNINGISFTNVTGNGGEVVNDLHGCPIDRNKRFGIIIQGTPANFRMSDWSIDYSARPEPHIYLRVPPTDFGSAGRKLLTVLPITIDTLGQTVTITPILDGISWPAQTFTTYDKTVVSYQFNQEVYAYNVGLLIYGDGIHQFEYYGMLVAKNLVPQPDPITYQFIQGDNLGVPTKKRVRTLPLIINTNGNDVVFSPIVDGVAVGPTSTFNTPNKKTVYHMFQSDTFGIDYGGTLSGAKPFDFHGFLQNLNVEELPIPRLFDQLGPLQMDVMGKVLEMRLRLVTEGYSLNYNVFADDVLAVSGSFPTLRLVDQVYIVKLPKTVVGSVVRVEIISPVSTFPFYRWYGQLRIQLSGMSTSAKWITAAGSMSKMYEGFK